MIHSPNFYKFSFHASFALDKKITIAVLQTLCQMHHNFLDSRKYFGIQNVIAFKKVIYL